MPHELAKFIDQVFKSFQELVSYFRPRINLRTLHIFIQELVYFYPRNSLLIFIFHSGTSPRIFLLSNKYSTDISYFQPRISLQIFLYFIQKWPTIISNIVYEYCSFSFEN